MRVFMIAILLTGCSSTPMVKHDLEGQPVVPRIVERSLVVMEQTNPDKDTIIQEETAEDKKRFTNPSLRANQRK